ncbi:hypothetical protein CCR75_004924 [Bremia lactucae]|uniref:Uncharacterized protein n=1 Tax=Bremia lactucae TaxID=4779 RepID=A0A976FHS1_BRELC|nr:hypothetical protein CCR75_004924 [Bremia lactucae]
MWRRWRRPRGKPTVFQLAVRQTPLDESSTTFVRRWKTETSFADLAKSDGGTTASQRPVK